MTDQSINQPKLLLNMPEVYVQMQRGPVFIAKRDLTSEDYVHAARAIETALGVRVGIDRGFIWIDQPDDKSYRWIRLEDCFGETRIRLKSHRVGKKEHYGKHGEWLGAHPNAALTATTIDSLTSLSHSEKKYVWMQAGCPCFSFVKVIGNALPITESEMSFIMDALEPWFLFNNIGQHKFKEKVLTFRKGKYLTKKDLISNI